MKHHHRRPARTFVRAVFLLIPFLLAGGALALSLNLAAAIPLATHPPAAIPPAQGVTRSTNGPDVLFASPEPRHSQAVAWGDVDGDGDLDLAVGNGVLPSSISWLDLSPFNRTDQLYVNDGRGHFEVQDLAVEPEGADDTRGLAWGDWDGDGDLDLAAANGSQAGGPQPNLVYENDGGALRFDAGEEGVGWQSAETRQSSSTGWGDWDGDGDLDLAFGNDDAPNQVYENISGTLRFDPAAGLGWEALLAAQTSSLAWGDWDGDGDLDLAFGNYSGSLELDFSFLGDVSDADGLQVYENISGTLQLAPDESMGWSSGAPALVQAIAWGDWDGDGDLDLAAGGGSRGNERGSFLQVWENQAGALTIDPAKGLGWELVAADGLAALSKPAGLAWADWNRDGDLDLIVAVNAGGGWGRHNQIYENTGNTLVLDPRAGFGWQSNLRADLNSETTFAVAAGDADGDGDPDVAFANGGIENGGQISLILRNGTPVIGFDDQPWESADARAGTGAAWGDWDGDGDLDLAVSNENDPVVVYENVDGQLGWDPALELGWAAPITNTANSTDVAWGDWNGDGALDLAVANDGAPDVVYQNVAGNLTLDPAAGLGWQSAISDTSRTRAVAWGDWDGDGDLDLALARAGDVAQVLENEAGTLQLDPSQQLGWESSQPLTAHDVAWGDWDDDGDLDLAVGARVYENEGDALLLDPDNGVGFDGMIEASSVAWGDVDGDGDLDLAAATADLGRVRVYENSGGRLVLNPRAELGWLSSDFMRVSDLAWGDADGDGDLDLATANATNWGFEPNQIFENVGGQLSTAAIWETADRRAESGVLRQSQAVAWGDVDGDGDLDLAFADQCTANDCPQQSLTNQIYYNTLQRTAGDRPALAIPLPNVIDPDDTATANFYASPDIVSSNVISIPYRLVSASSSTVGRVEMSYSLDGGDNWQPARPTATTQTTNLVSSPEGTNHVFGWDTFGSDFFGRSDNVVMQLVIYQNPARRDVAADGTYRYFNSVTGSFERPAATASTFPFRVQSTQIQVVDGNGRPVPGAWVYRLPAGQIDGAVLMPDPAQPQTTNDQGFLPGGGLLQPDDRLVALVPAPVAPVTFTNKVRLFYTSAPAAEAGLDMTAFEQPGIVSLTMSPDNPLLLFDLDVSLEWDARNDPTFLTGLTSSFQRASEILYDTTNGQAALGVVRVFQNKELWGQADVVVLANNGMRPSAAIGGVAKTPITETVRVGLQETKDVGGAYNGGQIRMGTVWDPYGENTAELGEEWWRALAHELAHYLLFLPDNYLGFKEGGVLGRVNCQGSFMTSTYDPAYSEFLIENEWVGDCQQSLAEITTGRTDWETILKYYDMLQPPGESDVPFEGPAVQPLALTDVLFWPPQEARTVIAARNYDVRDTSNERLRLPAAQAYLFQTQGTTDPTDDMLVALGSPTGGGDRLKVRGAYAGDRLCLIESSTGQAYIGCDDDVRPGDVSLRVAPLDEAWRPVIAAQSVTSRTVQITVTQALEPGEQAYVQLFPLHYWSIPNFAGLSPTATLQTDGDVHTATLTMTLPAYNVAVRVWAEGGRPREAISQFTLNPPWPVTGVTATSVVTGTNLAGPNFTGIGGPNFTGIGGPNFTGIGGPNFTGIGGPNFTGIGGPNFTGIGGPNFTGIGGPNFTGIGGANRSFNAPIRSADAQVVVYSKLGFFEDNGLETLQVLGSVPELDTHPWLTPVGQAYAVELDPAVTAPRVIGFNYLQRDVPEGYEHTLAIYYMPAGESSWQRLDTVLYVENLVVADLQAENGTYAIMSTLALPELAPGWNLIVYPLPDARPSGDALSSLGDRVTVVYESEQAGERPPDEAETNVSELEFAHTYWVWLDGDEPATLYLAPPRRAPDGNLPGG